VLTTATLGMLAYGIYATVWALAHISRLEWWVVGLEGMFGLLLMLAAAFVRVTFPGGLALALGAMLGLQALAIHDAAHLTGAVMLPPQIVRGIVAGALVLVGWLGSRGASPRPSTEPDSPP
jgi:hypothetical protein